MKKVQRRGYAVLENIYTNKEVRKMLSMINRATEDPERFLRSEEDFAIHRLLQEIPKLKEVLFNTNLQTINREGFGAGYFLTKAIYFDKPPQSNWYVTWHQDVPINVNKKVEQEGFRAWTQKKDITPPQEYLQSAFTIRVHLDDSDESNGALRVIPKSHFTLLSAEKIAELRDTSESKCCKVQKGGIHLMKPLILYASSKTENDVHRRVIHLEFNNQKLSGGLECLERGGGMKSFKLRRPAPCKE